MLDRMYTQNPTNKDVITVYNTIGRIMNKSKERFNEVLRGLDTGSLNDPAKVVIYGITKDYSPEEHVSFGIDRWRVYPLKKPVVIHSDEEDRIYSKNLNELGIID